MPSAPSESFSFSYFFLFRVDIKDVTPESKENIEKIAKEEKESLISVIKSTINLNTIANVRNTSNKTIPKSYYGEIVLNSYDDSGEEG